MPVLRAVLVTDAVIEEEVVDVILGKFDEAIEKWGDFDVGGIMVDRGDLGGGVPLVIALNNMIK
jgi:hypothetical protein